MIDSVTYQNFNNWKCNPLAASSSIELSKELNHPRQGLINMQDLMIMNALNGV